MTTEPELPVEAGQSELTVRAVVAVLLILGVSWV